MILGAHLSIAGGLHKAVERAKAIGCTALQIFSSPPQQWSAPIFTSDLCESFKNLTQNENITPVFVHGTYLINLASENSFLVHKSKQSLIEDLQFCSLAGIQGVIFHFGSHIGGWKGNNKRLVPLIHDILQKSPASTLFIIENSAGTGSKIGATLEELAQIKADVDHDRMRFCLDTAHAFAAGYDLRSEEAVNQFATQVEQTIGWRSVSAIHLNDSKIDLGKKNDRHENIGEGYIGEVGLQAVLRHQKIASLPFILETPGFDKNGPDKKNVDTVYNLINSII